MKIIIIEKYFGLVSGEVVIGTGFISDMIADISDTFGLMVSVYSDKIKAAKQAALAEMIKESVENAQTGKYLIKMKIKKQIKRNYMV